MANDKDVTHVDVGQPSRPPRRTRFEKEYWMRTPHEYVDGGLTPTGKPRGCACCGVYESFHDDTIPIATW